MESSSDSTNENDQSNSTRRRRTTSLVQLEQQDPEQVAAADIVLNGDDESTVAVPIHPHKRKDEDANDYPKQDLEKELKLPPAVASRFTTALRAQNSQPLAAADFVLNDGGESVVKAEKDEGEEAAVELASEEEGATPSSATQPKPELAAEDDGDDAQLMAEKRRVFSRRNVSQSTNSLVTDESSLLKEKDAILNRSGSRMISGGRDMANPISQDKKVQETSKQRSVRRIYGVHSKTRLGKKDSVRTSSKELVKQNYGRNSVLPQAQPSRARTETEQLASHDNDRDVDSASNLEDGLLAPPPTSLSRGARTRRTAELRPGAYDVRLSSEPRRASTVVVEESEELAQPTIQATDSSTLPSSSIQETEERSGLVQANLVQTDYVPEAEIVTDDDKPPEGRRRRLIINSIICMVVGIIGIVIGLTVGLNGNSSPAEETSSPTTSLSPSLAPSFQPSSITDAISERISLLVPWVSFEDSSSGQWRAREWASTDEATVLTTSDDLFLQRFALAVLHFATNASIPGFDLVSESNECQVLAPTLSCDIEGYVTTIDLANTSGFSGTIPPEIALLPRMTSFYASQNDWFGTIPSEVGLLTVLEHFEVASDEIDEDAGAASISTVLTGSLPAQISNLTVLRSLDFAGHQLVPTMPKELWQLTELENLAFGVDTSETFVFPSEIGFLTSLTNVNFGCCSQGFLATEIGLLGELQELTLMNHQLRGFLPSEVGQMTQLSSVMLSRLGIRGRVPSEIGILVGLEKLELSEVTLSGQLPSTIGSLVSLKSLSIVDVSVSGTLPSEISQMTSLQTLRLQGTNLNKPLTPELLQIKLPPSLLSLSIKGSTMTGEVTAERIAMPTEIGLLTQLTSLVLVDTLTGLIPSEVGQMEGLRFMDLQRNGLQGRIPSELFSLPYLWDLNLSKNLFRTTIPPEVGKYGTINSHSEFRLDLSESFFQGPVPTELGTIPVTYLDLSDNSFATPFPTELGNLNKIEELRLVSLSLVSIPSFVFNLTNLQDISLDFNPFEGTFPEGFGLLTSLTSLSIETNFGFGGILVDNTVGNAVRQSEVPSDLGLLTNLQRLNLAGCQLIGEIPNELTALQELYIQNTLLTGLVCENHAPGFVAFVNCNTFSCACCYDGFGFPNPEIC